MTAGMADVIAAHQALYAIPGGADAPMSCACNRWEGDVLEVHAAHVAEELAKAGYGDVREALRTTADEMQAERETWCLDESGRHWIKRTLDDLRERAAMLEASHGVD